MVMVPVRSADTTPVLVKQTLDAQLVSQARRQLDEKRQKKGVVRCHVAEFKNSIRRILDSEKSWQPL